MPRPRHAELSLLRDAVANAIGELDEAREAQRAADSKLAAARSKKTTNQQDAVDLANARYSRAVARLRTTLGLYLAAELDTPRTRKLWDGLTRAAPGLALDRNALDERRRTLERQGYVNPGRAAAYELDE